MYVQLRAQRESLGTRPCTAAAPIDGIKCSEIGNISVSALILCCTKCCK